jgi:Co/Zn/Cd efflux system component
MSHECCDGAEDEATGPFRRALWIVLAINAAMFVVEAGSGLFSGSAALQADALDFLGDTATYAITLMVLDHSLKWRASAAMLKGIGMAGFGGYVLALSAYKMLVVGAPEAEVMGAIGTLALIANVVSAVVLYRFRGGDSNRQSVWLCSRNDAIGNIAVIAAGGAVYLTGTRWPDLIVAVFMAWLALWSAGRVLRQARGELKEHAAAQAAE